MIDDRSPPKAWEEAMAFPSSIHVLPEVVAEPPSHFAFVAKQARLLGYQLNRRRK